MTSHSSRCCLSRLAQGALARQAYMVVGAHYGSGDGLAATTGHVGGHISMRTWLLSAMVSRFRGAVRRLMRPSEPVPSGAGTCPLANGLRPVLCVDGLLHDADRDGALVLAMATRAVVHFEEFCSDEDVALGVVRVRASVALARLPSDEVGLVRMLLLSHGFDPRPRPGPPGHESVLDITTDLLWMGRFTVAARVAAALRFARQVTRGTGELLRQVRALSGLEAG